MKNILLALLLFSASAKAQLQTKSEPEQSTIELNLKKCHQEYRAGTVITFLGIIGSCLALANIGSHPENAQPFAYGAGGFLALGWILQTDSHKFIGRIGGTGKVQLFQGNDNIDLRPAAFRRR